MRNIGVQSFRFDSQVLEALRVGRPAVFLMLDPDPGWVARVREASPETTLVGRLVGPSQIMTLTPRGGKELARLCLAKMEETGIRWWTGANERAGNTLKEVERLMAFEYAFAHELQKGGGRALIGGFGSGATPIPEDPDGHRMWKMILDVLRIADGFHCHEYWHVGEDGVIPHDDYHTGRFEKWYETLPDWAKEKWFLISELGIESPRGGWNGVVSPQAYLQALKTYGETLRRFPRFAATIFHAGEPLDPHWRSYDIRGTVLRGLTEAWKRDAPFRWGLEMRDETENLNKILRTRLAALRVPYEDLRDRYPDLPNVKWNVPQRKEELTDLVLHHTATSPFTSTDAIYENHRGRFGGIGYHFVVYCTKTESGSVWRKVRLVRSPLVQGAHVKDMNHNRIGLAWVGNWVEAPSPEELQGFEEIFREVLQGLGEWATHPLNVTAHRILQPGRTQCPGGPWVEEFLSKFTPATDFQRGYVAGWNAALEKVEELLGDLRQKG